MDESDLDSKRQTLETLVREAATHLEAIARGEFDSIAALCEAEGRDRNVDLAEGSGLEDGFWESERQRWEVWCRWWFGRRMSLLGSENSGAIHMGTLILEVDYYNAAIHLRKPLPIEHSDAYRSSLAVTWNDRGLALKDINSAGSLNAAIESYDEAIRLSQSLPFETNEEYRSDLASMWTNRGITLRTQNTSTSVGEAIKSFDEAIRLRRSQPISTTDDLARTWTSRGLALRHQNTPASLAEAITNYDEAIRLISPLPIEQDDELRNDLASAWMGRGIILQILGTPNSIAGAVGNHREAIRLRETLPVKQRHEYRNALAASWMHLGNALLLQNTAASVAEAINCYDEAICLRSSLPIDESYDYRNDLARTSINKGIALEIQRTPASLVGALNSFDKSLAVLYKLPSNYLPRVETELAARAGGCRMRLTLVASHQFDSEEVLEAACDLADEGLAFARSHFLRGIHFHLGSTAALFRQGALAYARHQPHFLAEFLLENLDPESPGSVPESPEMHAAALEILPQAFTRLRDNAMEDFSRIAAVESQIAELESAAARLGEIRDLYLAVTPEATRLQAAFHERTGDLEGARQCWEDYCLFQPRDVNGSLGLARWHLDHGSPDAATHSLESALLAIPEFLSLDESEEHGAARDLARELGGILGILVATGDLSVSAPAPPRWTTAELAARFRQGRARLLALLERFSDSDRQRPLREGLHEALERLEATHAGLAADSDSGWHDRLAGERERCRQLLEIQSAVVLGLFSRTFGYAEDALRQLGREMAGALVRELDRPDPDDAGTLGERLALMAARALDEILSKTAEGEAGTEARHEVEALLGEAFPLLAERPRKLLLFAERFLRQGAELAVFAGTAYGLVLEHELGESVFLSLRDRLRDLRSEGAAAELDYREDDHLELRLGPFLNGKRRHLMLGEMIGGFGKSLLGTTGLGRPVFDAVRRHVENDFRDPARLTTLSAADAGIQKSNLAIVLELRNASAHPGDTGPLSPDRLLAARSALAAPEGFLPIFLRARRG